MRRKTAAARADAAIAAQAAISRGKRLAAIEHAVEVLGEAGGEGEEMGCGGGERDRQRRRRHEHGEHVRQPRGGWKRQRDAVAPDEKLGRADRPVAVGIAGLQQVLVG